MRRGSSTSDETVGARSPLRTSELVDRLADHDDPLLQQTAHDLVDGVVGDPEQVERIFGFVRDDILFGFPAEGDFVKASETIQRRYGQCNTKGILFLALCQAVGLNARLHFSGASKEIQHGFFTGIFYRLMPEEISHSWIEVEIDGQWRQVDTYINDLALHNAAIRELDRRGWVTGYSVSRADGEPSAELSLDEARYSQMGAVIGDHGVWDRPADYFDSAEYLNRPSHVKQLLYRLYVPLANRRIHELRGNSPRN